ncbi:MAG: DUF1146 domain-containing protein [Erysipelotrichaceae bacterium]|nr:DUF1146 domain-containing protein [Erysipelotrichaceae bacterium]MDP3305301.1 DUF1146 domain-containing protein [Erysipelotrichaceae bacterium]
MLDPIPRILLYMFTFFLAMAGLTSVDFTKFVKKNKVTEAQILYISVAMVMAYAMAQFLLALLWK